MEENTIIPENDEAIESVPETDETEMETMTTDNVEENCNNECEKQAVAEENNEKSLETVTKAVEQLSKKMDDMNTLFIQKIQHTTHEEKIVDQMHAELQKYKDDMYSQLVRPILLDIIDVRDSILRMSKSYAAKPEGEQSVPLKVFSDYAYDVQDILEKNNISIYEGSEGDDFVPIKQRPVKKIETAVSELHGKIAESLSPGYDYMGKTISPEKVAVYLYKEQREVKGENE
ncbi:TPA: nucleotide exchange factor GrpE [Streptococcus suis]